MLTLTFIIQEEGKEVNLARRLLTFASQDMNIYPSVSHVMYPCGFLQGKHSCTFIYSVFTQHFHCDCIAIDVNCITAQQACIICGILASWMPGTFFPPGTFRHF